VDNAVLSLENVCKSYAIGTPVEAEILHGINLRLSKGEFVALIGPSGSGKSTLLNIMGLLDSPTSGKLLINAQDTGSMNEEQLTQLRGQTIGFVFQSHLLLTAFTALENVMMPMLLQSGHADDAMRARARLLLEQVGLAQWQNNMVNNMSGGQQQRVAIARALALNPSLVLADEPTGNLDTKSVDSVFELMRNVNRESGTTFLMVTHNVKMANHCDRIIELVDGKITTEIVSQYIGKHD
jgi:lipoprotein-releasing system ATP-binding protein